jgi:iron complex outermembrane receptor protein
MRRLLWAISVFVVPLTVPAGEPQTNTNVISAADDAFGIMLGQEGVGLYNPGTVRGFSPIAAGNVRLNGLYFDQQGPMVDRLVNDSRIRVGLSAVSFPWPAPTGNVDYLLRRPEDNHILTSIFYFGPYQNKEIDLDGHRSFCGGRVGIAAGVSYHHEEGLRGTTDRVTSFGILPQWIPSKDLTLRAFWGRRSATDQKAQPIFYLNAGQSPPRLPQRFFGQDWSGADYSLDDYGLLLSASLGAHWSVRAGIFRSVYDVQRNYLDLYLNTSSEGLGTHEVIAIPDQFYSSTSGEVQFLHTLAEKSWYQQIVFGLRGRNTHALYGGGDSVDLGVGVAGQFTALNRPNFMFSGRNADRIREYSFEASYTVQWKGYLDYTVGIQRPNYLRNVADPALGSSSTVVRPWLYNSSLVIRPTKRLTLFGTLTLGLEDSGIAPGNASNRGEVLGAARSSQQEIGVNYAFASSFTLVTAAFDIRKPYFALSTQNLFTNLGEERHRGVEMSLIGRGVPGLSLVAGATFLSPEVTAASAQESIGSKAVGQPAWLSQFAVDYRLARFPQLSVDCTVGAQGRRMARVDNRTEIPSYATLDLGMRYRMTFGRLGTVLRVQLLNATNTYNWYEGNDGGLIAIEPRRAWAYLTVDL